MSDHGNIVPFGDPRQRDRAAKRKEHKGEAVDPILEKLKSAPRKHEWYPVFARNLGKMALRLDQDKPLNAAKKMFQEAFGNLADANWRKRKRYLRFEREEASFESPGEYVSNNEPYRLLSDAFAKLHFAGDKDGPRKAHRMLTRGTSLNPGATVDASQTDGLSQVLEWMRDLQAKYAADQDIASALSCLNRFPIAPFGVDELEGGTIGRTMAAVRRGNGLSIVPAPTSTITKCVNCPPQTCWHVGRVLLGYLYFPQAISSVDLGLSEDECDAMFRASTEALREPTEAEKEEAELDSLHKLISEKLNELRIENFWVGDEYYKDAPVPYQLEREIYIRKPVYLFVAPKGVDLELKLDIAGEWFGDGPEHVAEFEIANPEVITLGATPEDDRLIIDRDLGWLFFNDLRGVKAQFASSRELEHEWGLRLVDSDNSTHVVGAGVFRNYPTISYSASVDDAEMRDALLEGTNQRYAFFKPVIWDDLSRLSAVPHGSIAASILRNLAFAPEEKRIDVLLMKDARERLQGVVEFVRSELEKTNTSLGARGLEFT